MFFNPLIGIISFIPDDFCIFLLPVLYQFFPLSNMALLDLWF